MVRSRFDSGLHRCAFDARPCFVSKVIHHRNGRLLAIRCRKQGPRDWCSEACSNATATGSTRAVRAPAAGFGERHPAFGQRAGLVEHHMGHTRQRFDCMTSRCNDAAVRQATDGHCPCALSLATPTALAVAIGSLARRGIVATRGHAIDALSHVTHVVFDKTGTLTRRQDVSCRDPVARWLPTVPAFCLLRSRWSRHRNTRSRVPCLRHRMASSVAVRWWMTFDTKQVRASKGASVESAIESATKHSWPLSQDPLPDGVGSMALRQSGSGANTGGWRSSP